MKNNNSKLNNFYTQERSSSFYSCSYSNLLLKPLTQRGYTLIELLIAVTIFTIVMGITLAVFVTNSRIQNKTQAVRDTSQAVRYIIEAIGREVQLADGCNSGDNRIFPLYTEYNEEQGLFLFKTDKSNSQCVMHSYTLDQDNGKLMAVVNSDFYNSQTSETKTLNSVNIFINDMSVSPQGIYTPDFYTGTCPDPLGNNPDHFCLDRQPSIRISLTARHEEGIGKAEEKSTQTIQTAFTTRNYPGFNDILQ